MSTPLDYDALRQALDRTLKDVEQWRITGDQVTIDEDMEPLGEGGYSTVYAASLKDRSGSVSDVAVKVLRAGLRKKDILHVAVALARELRVWATLQHPNVLPLLGFRLDMGQESAWIVSPRMFNGNVRDFFVQIKPELSSRMQAVRELTQALAYLHGLDPPVCHGDLKPDNLLINGNGEVVLSDFGLTVIPDTTKSGLTTTRSLKGTTRYLAPELLEEDEPIRTLKSDLWAWGCVAAEILTDEIPYAECTSDYKLIGEIVKGPPQFLKRVKNFSVPLLLWACDPEPSNRADIFQCSEQFDIAETFYRPSDPPAAGRDQRRFVAFVVAGHYYHDSDLDESDSEGSEDTEATGSDSENWEDTGSSKSDSEEWADPDSEEDADESDNEDSRSGSDSDHATDIGDFDWGVLERAMYVQLSIDGDALGIVTRDNIMVIDIETNNRNSLDLSRLPKGLRAPTTTAFSPDLRYCAFAMRTPDRRRTLNVWDASKGNRVFEDPVEKEILDAKPWALHVINETEVLVVYDSPVGLFEIVKWTEPNTTRQSVKYWEPESALDVYNISLQCSLLAIGAEEKGDEPLRVDIRRTAGLELLGTVPIPGYLASGFEMMDVAISENGTVLIVESNFSIWYCDVSEALAHPPPNGVIASPVQLVAYNLVDTFLYTLDRSYFDTIVMSSDGSWVMLHGEDKEVVLDLQTLALYELKRIGNSRLSGSTAFETLVLCSDGSDIVHVKNRSAQHAVSAGDEIWRFEAKAATEPAEEPNPELVEFTAME